MTNLVNSCLECGQDVSIFTTHKGYCQLCIGKAADRYHWLNKEDNFMIVINERPVRLKCGKPLDSWIDTQLTTESAK